MDIAMESKTKIKNLAEENYRITISDFGKRLLYPIGKENMDSFDLLYGKEEKTLRGKKGYFTTRNGMNILSVFYNIDVIKTPKILKIRFQNEKNDCNGIEQEIKIEENIATFGIRPFFTCVCGKFCTTLYKVSGENIFKCRICANISYNSQRQNKKVMNGLFYHTNKLLKLATMEEKISRTFYAGKYTKKSQKLMEKCKMWNMGVTENMKKSANYIKNMS